MNEEVDDFVSREEFNKLKNKLIEQEHRFIPSIKNLYLAFSQDDKTENARERKLASIYALASSLWKRRMLSMIVLSLGGITGTIIAILTLTEFKEQNKLIVTQNKEFIKSNNLVQEQNLQGLISTNGQMTSELIGDLYDSKKNSKLNIDSIWEIPSPLIHRISSVASALRAYSKTNTGYDIRDVSYERGDLLHALTSMGTNFPLYPNPPFDGSYLTGKHFENADLEDANLAKAYYYSGYMTNSNLSNSNLSGAYFYWSDFSEANLSSAHADSTDFTYVNFKKANLENVQAHGSLFFGADLTNASLKNADLKGADLEEATLNGVDFQDAILDNVNLKKANLLGAKYITVKQLLSAKSIDSAKIDLKILELLNKEK